MKHRALLSAACLLMTTPLPATIAAAQAQEAASPTRFTRDPALFAAKKEQVAAVYDQASPAAGAEVRALFAQDLLGMIAAPLARMGLSSEDVADAITIYWIAAYDASHGIIGQETDPTLARGARAQIGRLVAGMPQLAGAGDAEKQDLADTMLLQALLIEAMMQTAADGNAVSIQAASDQVHRDAAQLIGTDLRKVELTAAGFVPQAGAAAQSPLPAASPPQAAAAPASAGEGRHAANWETVDGVYFKMFQGFGVGGMLTLDYEPVVLFTDGTYYEVEGAPLEDVDLAASRRAEPSNWGRWARNGNSFTLTDWEGDADTLDLQDGQFFKAFASDADGNRLSQSYERISGGGNTAFGGELMIVSQSELNFAPDGRYSKESFGGAMSSGAQSGTAMTAGSNRRTAGIGRYTLDRHTIILTEPDGTSTRQFFAFGSGGTPPELDRDLIFVGDRVFVHMSD